MSGVGRRVGARDGTGRDGEREAGAPIFRDALPAGVSPLVWPDSNSGRAACAEIMRARLAGAAGSPNEDDRDQLAGRIDVANVSPAQSPPPLALQTAARLGLGDRSGVKLHTGPESAAAAEAADARALTVGQHIHFGAGEYDPSSPAGQELLGHELAHTAQQQGSAATAQAKPRVSEPQEPAEEEADRYSQAHGQVWRELATGTADGAAGAVAHPITAQSVPMISRQPRAAPRPPPTKEDRAKMDAALTAPRMAAVLRDGNGKEIARWFGAAPTIGGELPTEMLRATRTKSGWKWTRGGAEWQWSKSIPHINVTLTSPGLSVESWANQNRAARIVLKYAPPAMGSGQGVGTTGQGTGGDGDKKKQPAASGAGDQSRQGQANDGSGAAGASQAGAGDGPISVENATEDLINEIQGRDEGPEGAGTGTGGGEHEGAGSAEGSERGRPGGEADESSWVDEQTPGAKEPGRIGDPEDGKDHGIHGGTPDAGGHVDGAGWWNLLDAPEDIAPLVNAGLLLADADIAGLGAALFEKALKGLTKRALRKEMHALGRKTIEHNMDKVRAALHRSRRYRSMPAAEKGRILKRAEAAIEHAYYKKAAAYFRQRAEEYEALAKKGIQSGDEGIDDVLGQNARDNASAFRRLEGAANDGADDAAQAAEVARKVEKEAQEHADAAKKKLDEQRDAARAEGKEQGAGGLEWTNQRKQVVAFEGYEVRSVRDLSHMADDDIRDMAQRGVAGQDKRGVDLEIHHLEQNPSGPFMEMAEDMHDVHNIKQHPRGNERGGGLTEDERKAFDAWRGRYWRARGRDEMARRGLK